MHPFQRHNVTQGIETEMSKTSAQTLAMIRSVPYFARLDEADLARVLDRLVERRYEAGQCVFFEQDACAGLHLVVTGRARIHRVSLEGREQVLAELGPGDSCNEVPAVDGGPNPASCVALEPTTIWLLSREALDELREEIPSLNDAIIRSLAARCRQLVQRVYNLSFLSVTARVAHFLVVHTEPERPLSRRRWTQEEIAAEVGTVREMVGRALLRLAEDGFIRLDRHRIHVVDRDGLREMSQEAPALRSRDQRSVER
jgi:CRP/FNR family transcriptional regulator